MEDVIFKNEWVTICREKSQIPWLKIFTTTPYKELTDCPEILRKKLYLCMEIVENHLRKYYKPQKINIAMFGNYVPHLHVHIMARFQEDDFYPESVWGKKQRDNILNLPSFDSFLHQLIKDLNSYM